MHYLFGVYKGEKMAGTTNRGEDHMESLPLSFYPEASISSEERKPGCLLPLDSFLREFLRDSVICMLLESNGGKDKKSFFVKIN